MSGKAIRETVGFLAVVAGLVFVGVEIRQNNTLAQAAAYESIGSRLADSWETLALEWPELAHKLVKNTLTTEDLEGFSEVEMTQAVGLSVSILRQLEITWRQVQLGLLDESALNYFGNDAPVGADAGMGNWERLWPQLRPWMSPDFAAYVEEGFVGDGR